MGKIFIVQQENEGKQKMNDLISKATVRDLINTWGRIENESVRMQLLHSDLNTIPSVDAVPVVRCKDCKYYVFCYLGVETPREDFYCADGERRDSNE